MQTLPKIAMLAMLTLLSWSVVGGFISAEGERTANAAEYVQTTCDAMLRDFNDTSKQACGDAQTKANAEYLCNNSGSCWVEVK